MKKEREACVEVGAGKEKEEDKEERKEVQRDRARKEEEEEEREEGRMPTDLLGNGATPPSMTFDVGPNRKLSSHPNRFFL